MDHLSMMDLTGSLAGGTTTTGGTTTGKQKSTIRGTLTSTLHDRGADTALERAAVAIIVIRLDGTKGPVVHQVVPDVSHSDSPKHANKNPLVEEMIEEASGRLLECMPENNWSIREEWVSLLRRAAMGTGPYQQEGGDRSPTAAQRADFGSADIAYLAPRAINVSDCSYFVLYMGDQPGQSQQLGKTGRSIRSRRRRIYGICRRAPRHLPYTVVLLCAVPCYGLLRHQFMSVTSLYFDKRCEGDEADFQTFLLSIAHPTTGVLHREAGIQNYGDLAVMWLVSRLGIEHVLGLVKLVLLEGRILLFSCRASMASCAVLALLTLIPGLYNQGLAHEDACGSHVHGYRWKKFGMPLRIFHDKDFLLQPLLVMSQAESVFQQFRGFLVGTSNAMISKLHAAKLDAVVDLDMCTIDSQRFADAASIEQVDLARVAFEFGPADALFVEEVMDSLPSKNSPLSTQEDLLQSSSEWDGSDSWIRKHFQTYFEKLLCEASQALHSARTNAATTSWVRQAVSGILTPGRSSVDPRLMDFNRAWVHQWMKTRNYAAWAELYPHPCLQEMLDKSQRVMGDGRVPGDGHVNYTYPSGDVYVGSMVGGKRQGQGTYLEHATGNTYEGEWKADLRHGKGTLTTGASDFLYDGDWLEDRRTGRGHCTIRGRETYIGQWLNNKFHGQGKYCDADGNVYEGEWVHGRREGAGTMTKVDGEVYLGEWKAGQRSGMGQCNYADGSVYVGGWKEGRRSGEGTLEQDNGDRYEGMWVDDLRQGWGTQTCVGGDVKEGEWSMDQPTDGEWKITYSNGDQFVGQCKEGRPHGYGVCKFASSDVYTGDWEDGLRSGRGVCIYASGEKFDGLWSCNQPLEHDYTLQASFVVPLSSDDKEKEREGIEGSQRGAGLRRGSSQEAQAKEKHPRQPSITTTLAGLTGPASVVYPSGDKYDGDMVEGKRHGKGTYYERATGNKYEGEWKDDMRHGRGVLTSGASDFIYDGEWVGDKRTGNGHCTIRGRESYTGQWLDNKFHGKGKYVDSDGNIYEGEWAKGAREGAGSYTKADGEVYVGEWRNGLRSGSGQCTFADGGVYSGHWREGKMNGEGTLVSSSSERHEGQWADGKRNGWGVWTSPTGDVVEGEWYADEPKDGEWKICYSNGDHFVGKCKEGRPHGYGVCKYANGAVYTGEWEDGMRSGHGVCVFANGEQYDGLWEKDHVSLRGMGTLKFQDGRVHEFS